MPLTTAMRDLIGQLIIGSGTSFLFNNTNAQLHVGDSTQAFGSSQNGCASSGANFVQASMNGGYPAYSVTSGGPPAMIFQSTFGTAVGNFHWQEWCVKNSSASGTSTGTGVALNRVQVDLGTKTGVQTWQLTVVITPTT